MGFAVTVLHACLGGWWLAAPDDARCDAPQRCWQAGGSLQATSSCLGDATGVLSVGERG